MRKVLGAVVAAALAGCASAGGASDPSQATVEGGALAGTVNDGISVFRNIPYAAAPVGDLRWAPTQPAPAWAALRDATRFGPACPQAMNPNGGPNPGGASGPMSEDCLQLNVFAPTGASKAPVMVWIHGGSNRTGMAAIYDGTNFARDGVVVVTINYRLGALGYLAHPALTKAANGQPVGNYGLMDQIAALKWVQQNITAFGGNPANVTVFGESAGGWNTLAVLATPSARGLYHKAIVQSGGGWYPPATLAQEEAQGVTALAAIGVSKDASAADLRAIPVETLATLATDYAPFSDGQLMTETPSQALAAGRIPDVPLMIGWNSGEDTLMGPSPLPAATLALIPPIAKMVYPAEAKAGDEALARVIFTDSLFGAPARWVAAQASGGQPSWLYHFSYVAADKREKVKSAGHATEIPYAFKLRSMPVAGDMSDADLPLADLMHACWVSFAKEGRPVCGAGWPSYSPATDQLMEFGVDPGVRTGFKKSQFAVQETIGLANLKLGSAGK
jgi:para-nitrobenzyl esterase